MPFPKTEAELAKAGYKFEGTGRCSGEDCGREIEWWRTPKTPKAPNGKSIPLDPGSLEPHWATCPNKNQFRGHGTK